MTSTVASALRDGDVQVVDLSINQSYHVNFPNEYIDTGKLGWVGISQLVPLSPDGHWAAYAGSQSSMVLVDPDGRPDRGRPCT